MIVVDARYSDGQTAKSWPVQARVEGGALVLQDAGGRDFAAWPLADLRLIDEPVPGASGRLSPGVNRPERLLFESRDLLAFLGATSPALRRDPYGTHRTWRIAAMWAVAAIGGIAGLFLIVIPLLAHQIAYLLPTSIEIQTGEWIAGKLAQGMSRRKTGPSFCNDPQGLAVLERLTARLVEPARLYVPLRVRVADIRMVNAVALPGGQVVLFRGLIEKAKSPSEVIGVLAHEIAHVELRHPTEVAIKKASVGFVIGMLVGDVAGASVVATLADTLVSNTYSREAESAADARAFEMLSDQNISARGLAEFMERMAAEEAKISGALAYLSTHPLSADRARAARAADQGRDAGLSDADWQALQKICTTAAD
jgi:beta-barrel assembly-enhancing protease